MKTFLFKNGSIAPLVVFRIFFGLLVAAESFGAIATGWVKNVLIEPKCTFSFIGFEWLQPLPGYGMYFYFILMGIFGIAIMLGYRYRIAIIGFTILWAGVYFMQKTAYNNHYYLLLLISLFMVFFPANKSVSLDVKQFRVAEQVVIPKWINLVFIIQVTFVYFFAALAKIYPDWLNGTFTKLLLQGAAPNTFFLEIFSKPAFYLFIAYMGIVYDLLIVPLLLFKKTRTIALLFSVVFHIFNAVFLQIGIFPFFALSFSLFFYPPETINRIFLKRKKEIYPTETTFFGAKTLYFFFIPFLMLQFILPLRHHFIEGDVLWTEEGHRLSWRMMLRQRDGFITIKIRDNVTNVTTIHDFSKNVTQKQMAALSTKPDFIWQYCQRLKTEYKGKDISIFIDCQNSINNGAFKTLIDPKQDFTKAEWHFFKHNNWIVLH